MRQSVNESLCRDATPLRTQFGLDPQVTYLNHGAFGATPLSVIEAERAFQQRMLRNPQQFLARDLERLLDETTDRLGTFLGCSGRDLILTDNATAGMNLVSNSFPLESGDQVLLTTHEYGAVKRIWQQRALPCSAEVVQAPLRLPLTSEQAVVDDLFACVTPRTRLIVVSDITSPTALKLPIEAICRQAQSREIAVCVDGPHAIGIRDLELQQMGCDFYAASCHKWLSAPTGTGFLYVHPRWQSQLRPYLISWGGTTAGLPASWKDEYRWQGTRNLCGWLALPAAIEFLEQYGWNRFRTETHQLARYARQRLLDLCGTTPITPDEPNWYGSMVTVPLPETVPVPSGWTGFAPPLQHVLADKYQIEVPVVKWGHRMWIRVSCHLHNDANQIDLLCECLERELSQLA